MDIFQIYEKIDFDASDIVTIVLVLIAAWIALEILLLILLGAFRIFVGIAPKPDESMTPVLLLLILWVIAFPVMVVLSLIVGIIYHISNNIEWEKNPSIVEVLMFYLDKNQDSETLLPPYKKPAGFYGTRALLGSILIVIGASLIIYLIDYLF